MVSYIPFFKHIRNCDSKYPFRENAKHSLNLRRRAKIFDKKGTVEKMYYNCLIVDDETELAKMTCEYFTLFDVSCIWTDTAQGCEELLREHTIDILLLDINLEEESGFLLCKKIRETYDMPILFISARQSDEDILAALAIGGDDYIKKPYTLSVLLAKVKAILKRMEIFRNVGCGKTETDGVVRDGDVWLNTDTMWAGIGERQAQLKAKEFKLFACLFEHRNAIVPKETLFNTVWGDTFFGDGTLNVHIRKLREKLEKNPNEPEYIKTVWGTGYLLKTGQDG